MIWDNTTPPNSDFTPANEVFQTMFDRNERNQRIRFANYMSYVLPFFKCESEDVETRFVS